MAVMIVSTKALQLDFNNDFELRLLLGAELYFNESFNDGGFNDGFALGFQ